MYCSDLGWCSAQSSKYSSSDDAWIAERLEQIAGGAHPSELISRWTFKTRDASKFSYLYHLTVRVSSYALLIIPGLWLSSIGVKMMDYLMDRGQCFYSKIRGTQTLYERKKELTQLFLTLSVAEFRLSCQEAVDNKVCGVRGHRLYPNHEQIQVNTLNQDLLNRAYFKTLGQLTQEDLKILLIAIQFLPVCRSFSPGLQKNLALHAISRCEGKIKLPPGLKFDGNEIDLFFHTKCVVDINGATFSNISNETLELLDALHNYNPVKDTPENFSGRVIAPAILGCIGGYIVKLLHPSIPILPLGCAASALSMIPVAVGCAITAKKIAGLIHENLEPYAAFAGILGGASGWIILSSPVFSANPVLSGGFLSLSLAAALATDYFYPKKGELSEVIKKKFNTKLI